MTARPKPAWVSPSLAAVPGGVVPAFETKFLLAADAVREVESWAAAHLTADPHGDPALGGRYRVTSVYLDTPAFDVYRKTDGYRGQKHRVRRYGAEPLVHLERKSKADGRVWKTRTVVAEDQLGLLAGPPAGWPAEWFADEVRALGLRPACRVSYERTAFVGGGPTGPIRLTMDRAAFGVPADGLTLPPVTAGLPLLADSVVVEFKYLAAMPAAFQAVDDLLQPTPSGGSKFRKCVAAAGLVPPEAAGAGGEGAADACA